MPEEETGTNYLFDIKQSSCKFSSSKVLFMDGWKLKCLDEESFDEINVFIFFNLLYINQLRLLWKIIKSILKN